jgi:UPF0176 protein
MKQNTNILHNIYSREELTKKLFSENFNRTTLSFYRYVKIDSPQEMRNLLYYDWNQLNVLGRIYLAKEGINAQLSVPEHHFEEFKNALYLRPEFKDVPFKIAIEDDGKSFIKLIIKVRNKIVADGLPDDSFDTTNVGNHLTAKEFNEELSNPNSITVDMRNQYESEVGHFEGAILPDADTFRDELPMVLDILKGKENKKILLYCTGGIRCEKASAYLKHKGFQDVNQLYGGIISYAREVDQLGLENKFRGKNFVFDERLGERISKDIISKCHICGSTSDRQLNCANNACHILFIQCETCGNHLENCCSEHCKDVLQWPKEKQLEEKKKNASTHSHHAKLRTKVFTK